MLKETTKRLVKESGIIDTREETDTIRLWESYRDQATLWRAMALLMLPTMLVMSLLCFYLWSSRSVTLNVPAKPLPGTYASQEIPDTEFIDVTTEFLNLIASYQYNVARRQYEQAARMLQEPVLSRFNSDMLGTELKTIESTNRTQIFFVDPATIAVDRAVPRQVTVSMSGDRMKLIAGRELPLVKTRFSVTMSTVPRNSLNPYGIVITDFGFENVER